MVRIEDFSVSQIDLAARARDRFDVALVFSTKYQPPHPLFGIENWEAWQRIKEKFFGYHRDLLPEDIAQRLGGTIAYHKERNGQWIAVIAVRAGTGRESSWKRPRRGEAFHIPIKWQECVLTTTQTALARAQLERVARRQR